MYIKIQNTPYVEMVKRVYSLTHFIDDVKRYGAKDSASAFAE